MAFFAFAFAFAQNFGIDLTFDPCAWPCRYDLSNGMMATMSEQFLGVWPLRTLFDVIPILCKVNRHRRVNRLDLARHPPHYIALPY